MDKFIKVFKAEIKAIDEKENIVVALVSSKKTDRDGDIVMPDAFTKGLKNYKEHPVLLSSHNYSDLRKQIGEAVSIKVVDEGLEAKFKYYVGGDVKNDEAEWAWVLAKRGVSAYSIGFIGNEFEWMKDKDAEGNERITGRRFTNVELLEISQVLIPSNRDALQSRRSLATEEAELCEMAIKSIDKGEFSIDDLAPPKVVIKDIEQKPKPKPDESRNDYMARCIPMLIDEGKDKDQAVAQCSAMFDEGKGKHYSDALLGTEGKPISEPKGELGISEVKEAINQAVKKTKESK